MLVDSHAHLDAPEFKDDRDGMLARAQEAGVGLIISIGVDVRSTRAALRLAEKYLGIFVSVGFHPHDARRMKEEDLAQLSALCQHPKVVAVGETGLDFYRNLSPREAQIKAFKGQLELARRHDLPVIIHSRNATGETLSLIKEWAQEAHPLGVMHCFSGDEALAEEYLELGFFISLAGPVTYPEAVRPVEVARFVPLDRLLVETDCPYLTPHPYRGQRNEPAHLPVVVQRIAQIRGIPTEAVAEATAQNAARLFGLSVFNLSQKGAP